MTTVIRNYAYQEYILKDGFQTLDNVSLITQIERLREILARMRNSSQTVTPVLERKLYQMVNDGL